MCKNEDHPEEWCDYECAYCIIDKLALEVAKLKASRKVLKEGIRRAGRWMPSLGSYWLTKASDAYDDAQILKDEL